MHTGKKALDNINLHIATGEAVAFVGPSGAGKTTLANIIANSKSRSLEECLLKEYRLSQKMTNRQDFAEGIKAVLIEKHHNPKWSPSSIKKKNKKELENLFD